MVSMGFMQVSLGYLNTYNTIRAIIFIPSYIRMSMQIVKVHGPLVINMNMSWG